MLAIEAPKRQIDARDKNKIESDGKLAKLRWPVYVLRGNCTVFTINVPLNKEYVICSFFFPVK